MRPNENIEATVNNARPSSRCLPSAPRSPAVKTEPTRSEAQTGISTKSPADAAVQNNAPAKPARRDHSSRHSHLACRCNFMRCFCGIQEIDECRYEPLGCPRRTHGRAQPVLQLAGIG